MAKRVWDAFWKIDARARTNNGYAFISIPPSEIEAWCNLHGETFAPWEIDLLDIMEIARLEWLNRKEDQPEFSPQMFKDAFDK